MNPKTKQALEASIVHWEENLKHAQAGDIFDMRISSGDCALCIELYDGPELECQECPVKVRTGYNYCRYTPYPSVNRLFLKVKRLTPPFDKNEQLQQEEAMAELVQATIKEIDFLKSLREES